MASISTLVDRVRIRVLSSGNGPFSLGPAVPAYRGVEALTDAATYSYAVENDATYEVGTGVYISSTQTFVRSPIMSSAGGAPISFPSNVELVFTALAQDIVATGGSLPILNSLGNATDKAISQKATTDAIGALTTAVGGVSTSLANYMAELLASTALGGANLIGFTHDGITEGTLAAAFRLHANPMNAPWNAVGDGVTDDTAAINACILWVKNTIGGGVVDLTHPHLIDSGNLVMQRYVSLRMRLGNGSCGNPSFFGHTNAYADLALAPKLIINPAYRIDVSGTGGSCSFENLIIGRKGLAYDGNDLPANYAGTAIKMTTCSGVMFSRCTFLGFNQAAWSDGSSQVRFEYCQFDNLNSIRFTNGFDLNSTFECRSYNFLQAGVTGTDPRTMRDGTAYLCDGAGNGGHMFINTFAYGYRKAFSMETQGSYSFPGCWADGPRDATTGKSLWADGVGFNLISGNTAVNAECQIAGFKASAQATGIYIGPNMYGATIITNFHMWECNDSIVVANPNVVIGQGAIRGYFNSAVKFADAASANGSSVTDLVMYARQGAPSAPVDINCGGGDPVLHNVRYVGGVINIFNKSAYTVTPVSELITYDFNRDVMFVDGTGVVGDMQPKVSGKILTFIFKQDAVTTFGGPDGPSTFYNDLTNGNFQTNGPFKATAGSSITFYRNVANTRWIECGRTLFNNTPITPSLRVITSAGAVTANLYDSTIIVNKATGAATAVALAASPATGKRFTIKDGKGDAATNNITITPAAGTIDGAANLVINTNYGRATLVYNGTQWNVI